MSVEKVHNNRHWWFPNARAGSAAWRGSFWDKEVLNLGDVIVHSTVSLFQLGKLYDALKIVLHSSNFLIMNLSCVKDCTMYIIVLTKLQHDLM